MNIEAFTDAPWLIQIHALCALTAFAIGLIQWLGPKGQLPHRLLGMTFVALMTATAVSAFFIRQINDGAFSWIHIFVPVTLVGLTGLVWSVRRGDLAAHRKNATSLFFAALIIPGLFAFLPGRLMFTTVIGATFGS
ncbi:DUF2306 domain-containing protein [Maricaulis maris]|uniref:DUF2306 domain-containing protein n=1 Tax=Maricaulis maris TaxID=74318 RepID=UPI003B8DB142